MSRSGNYLVVGVGDGLISQVLLALHVGCRPRRCSVLCRPDGDIPRFLPYASRRIESAFDGSDDERVAAQLAELCQQQPDLLAIPADCEGAEFLHRLRAQLKLRSVPAPDPAMLACFDDKWAFYRFCKAQGLRVPESLRLESKHAMDFDGLAKQLGTPFVIKPLRAQGSIGVKSIASKSQWQSEVMGNEDYRHAPLIAQRFIAGTDIGINLLALGGEIRALAMQQRAFPQRAGSRISFFYDRKLEAMARQLCAASGYEGVMNIDARIEAGSGQVWFFESNPRFWQSLSASAWCGLNFVEKCCFPPAAWNESNRLSSGTADTYYHPLFRPAMLRRGLISGEAHRRSMTSLMLMDTDLLRRGMKEHLREWPAMYALLRHGQRGVVAAVRAMKRAPAAAGALGKQDAP